MPKIRYDPTEDHVPGRAWHNVWNTLLVVIALVVLLLLMPVVLTTVQDTRCMWREVLGVEGHVTCRIRLGLRP